MIAHKAAPRRFLRRLALHGHTDLLQQLFAMLLNEIGEVRQRLAGRKSFLDHREPAWEAVKNRQAVQRHSFETRMPTTAFRFLPQCLAFPSYDEVIIRAQQNEVVDHRWL